jgi:hypothetical protein
MDPRRHSEGVAIVLIIAIVAFFPLALAFGRDSRPYDSRGRRWI